MDISLFDPPRMMRIAFLMLLLTIMACESGKAPVRSGSHSETKFPSPW
jgi:hypothetical protein